MVSDPSEETGGSLPLGVERRGGEASPTGWCLGGGVGRCHAGYVLLMGTV